MIKPFLINLILACLWMIYSQQYTIWSAIIGFAAGYAVIALYCMLTHKNRYHIRLLRCIQLFFYFHWELLTSSVKVLWDIVTPTQHNKPGFVMMPLAAKTPLEIFFTANMISLTPGTLSIALSNDYSTLYIHAMFIHDLDKTIQSLKHFESMVLKAFR